MRGSGRVAASSPSRQHSDLPDRLHPLLTNLVCPGDVGGINTAQRIGDRHPKRAMVNRGKPHGLGSIHEAIRKIPQQRAEMAILIQVLPISAV